ncbi:MAG: SGNH/GDSL hydrolase family protein [Gammaproteobacteria bacterium]|jgi:lysophospholipase L1-like esterase|nr:SGNH/GDSL hydrolase family protein [Gammaproteobacteria bacterium]MBU1504971.1 SGNH/GDSL hydrolase family protein [Gammaproteobacteria bacterium]MBU2122170.1 SGNH/GDSL hydrolase family protein [Gammaproteobacteria bacterium]MBU2172196.1 SGNH/GDSL hydrolase family protein [Gammaproteobacteria bacterium]MBU2198729.1 SGNH/GDSL hydrolase family protein [Gammaproteobacteria bacterium]
MPYTRPTRRPSSTRRLATLAAVVAGALLVTACAPWRIWTAAELARESQPYTAHPAQPTKRLLVVGDSTAVGTGAATPAESLPGLIGQQHPQWRIDNLATNGAKFGDIVQQLETAPKGYDLVLVLGGGNDVIRFTAEDTLRPQLQQTVALARDKGQHVVVMPCGNVGHAPFFIPPLSWAMSRRSETLHALVQEVTTAQNVRYVRLLKPRDQDPFVIRSKELNAEDGLHPSSAGYQEWYRELVAQGGLAGLDL